MFLLDILYVVCAVALMIFSLGIIILLLLWLRHHRDETALPAIQGDQWPLVLVQLPIYNEQAVIKRLLDAVTALDYPRDKLCIQVLDDSDDDTPPLVARQVAAWRAQGFAVEHVRRPQRTGYKAGALAYGLMHGGALAQRAEFVAIFDADFVPSADFLRRTVPHFLQDARLGIVQARWAHLNATQNLITRSQAMSIDAHFAIEQLARNRGGLLLSFNGTAGVWRRACIQDAGDWAGDTLAEDLDLSYRAQMCGWRYLYLPQVAVNAELPPQVAAYKRQQARWAKGTTQNLRRLLRRLWRTRTLTLPQKLMGSLHLCQYLPQPVLLLMTLLTPPLLVAGRLADLPLAPLGLVGLAAPMMYVISQFYLYRHGQALPRLAVLPLLIALGSGMIVNNSVAVAEAFLGRQSAFKRTPKFSDANWHASRYALLPHWTTACEVLMAVYTAFGVLLAVRHYPPVAPFLLGQVFGFAAIATLGIVEGLQIWLHSRAARMVQTN